MYSVLSVALLHQIINNSLLVYKVAPGYCFIATPTVPTVTMSEWWSNGKQRFWNRSNVTDLTLELLLCVPVFLTLSFHFVFSVPGFHTDSQSHSEVHLWLTWSPSGSYYSVLKKDTRNTPCDQSTSFELLWFSVLTWILCITDMFHIFGCFFFFFSPWS